MTTNPAEVTLTDRSSALTQRVLAAVSLAGVVGGGIALLFSGEPWWAIALWELGLLLVALIMLAIGSSAKESAKETVALVAAGTTVLGEVVDSSSYDNGEDRMYELTLWIPLPEGGFQTVHRCSRASCVTTSQQPDGRLTVLVDPVVRTWAVVH